MIDARPLEPTVDVTATLSELRVAVALLGTAIQGLTHKLMLMETLENVADRLRYEHIYNDLALAARLKREMEDTLLLALKE
jgi:hypothetical protein